MALEKLQSLGTYEEINSGAHRKAASIVGTPALIRRIGLWNAGCSPCNLDPAAAGKRWSGRKLTPPRRRMVFAQYLSDLEGIIREAHKKGKSCHIHFDENDFSYISDSALGPGTLAIYRLWWYGMRTTIRVEYQTEYITITSVLDLSVEPDCRHKKRNKVEDHQYLLEKTLEKLGQLFESRQKEHEVLYGAIALVQERVWEDFEREILDAEVDWRRNSSKRRSILGRRLGEVFADFHGMIAGSLVNPRRGSPVVQRMRPPFMSPSQRERDRPMNYVQPGSAWFYDTLDRLWPLLHSDKSLRDYEFTASAFLEGRALYVSALGPQPRQSGHAARDKPGTVPKRRYPGWPWTAVYYYIQAHTDDEWQIGRLVDRINTLGTLRLAATMEVAGLTKAGARVDKLLRDVKETSKAIQDEILKTKSKKTEPEAVEARQRMKEIDRQLNEIVKQLWDINELVSSDISYRLERSSYYLQQFENEAEALREERIEGYQKYHEFVIRRLSGMFSYFDLLRQRMKEIESSFASLGRQYSSLKIAYVTSSIDDLVSEMKREDVEIKNIQEFGEVALVGFLMPYYVGMIAYHIFEMEHHKGRLYWLPLIVTLFVGILVWRRRDKDRGKPWRKNVSLAFVVYWVVMSLAFIGTHWDESKGMVRWMVAQPRALLAPAQPPPPLAAPPGR